jgi:hypothetical protein
MATRFAIVATSFGYLIYPVAATSPRCIFYVYHIAFNESIQRIYVNSLENSFKRNRIQRRAYIGV